MSVGHPDAARADGPSGVVSVLRRTRPRVLVAVLGLGVFFAGFDQTFVVTILPDMMSDLDISVDEFGRTAWIVNGYLLGYTVVLPLMGRVADAVGRLRIYTLAVVVYCLGSIGVAVAPDLGTLTVLRAIQAVGGGAILPISIAIVADVVRPGRRALAIGIIAALDDTSSLLGPLYAAALSEPLGWRGLFWLNVPLQIPFAVAIWWLLGERGRGDVRSVDWTGGAWLVAGLTCATVGLTQNVEQGSGLRLIILCLLAVVALGGFVRRQRRTPNPLVRLSVLRERGIRVALGLYAIDGALTITALVAVPLMANALWDGSVLDGGLALGRLLVWLPIGAVIGGALTGRLGYRSVGSVSFVAVSIGYWLMWAWAVPPTELALWGTLFVVGMGIGLNDAPILGSVVSQVSPSETTTVVAVTQTVQTLGMIVGTALLAVQGLGRFEQRAADLFTEQGAEAGAEAYQGILWTTFQEVFVVAGTVAAAAAVLALALAPDRSERTLL